MPSCLEKKLLLILRLMMERLNQPQLDRSFHRRPTIGDVEFAVNPLGMGTYGTQSHDQFTGNFGASEFGGEQSEDFEFSLAEGFDEWMSG